MVADGLRAWRGNGLQTTCRGKGASISSIESSNESMNESVNRASGNAKGSPPKPRLAAVRPQVAASPAAQRYTLSCAAVTAAAQVLVAAHVEAGVPGPGIGTADLPLRYAIAQARTAGGAMSVVAGRLLTLVRQDEKQLLPGMPDPVRRMAGVTSAGVLVDNDHKITARAFDAAFAECEAAVRSMREVSAPDGLIEAMLDLLRVAERLAPIVAEGGGPADGPQNALKRLAARKSRTSAKDR
jgi:hypothetical protein